MLFRLFHCIIFPAYSWGIHKVNDKKVTASAFRLTSTFIGSFYRTASVEFMVQLDQSNNWLHILLAAGVTMTYLWHRRSALHAANCDIKSSIYNVHIVWSIGHIKK